MTAPKRYSGLELSEDMAYQRRTWLVERVGWVVLAAILLAALLGLFGGGGLVASAEMTAQGGSLSMHYDRYWRWRSPMRLRIVARPPDAGDASLRLWVARDYLESVSISSIMPQPDGVEAAEDRYVFRFSLVEPGQTATLLFNLEPRRAFRLSGRVGVEGGDTLTFTQFVYP